MNKFFSHTEGEKTRQNRIINEIFRQWIGIKNLKKKKNQNHMATYRSVWKEEAMEEDIINKFWRKKAFQFYY